MLHSFIMPFELNRNVSLFESPPGYTKRGRNESLVSISSASSGCQSDSGEDFPNNEAPQLSRKSSYSADTQNGENKRSDFSRLRSMSEGASSKMQDQDPFEVFPSLPDSVLHKMGLLGSELSRERVSEEDLEQKFISLSLAFKIDETTVKDRNERQRRNRDQTEKNFSKEIEKLIQNTNKIQPLCVDAETTDLLFTLLTQIDIVARAAAYATISSERYGAVQQENRISESVSLMINHVNVLKQQRDSARRQLQYSKKMLQSSSQIAEPSSPVKTSTFPNGKITRRRASIATITQSSEPSATKLSENKKMARRTSDLSLRATSALNRSSRPSRLELGVDLVKIREGLVESENTSSPSEPAQSDSESTCNENSSTENAACEKNEILPHTLRQRLGARLAQWSGRWQAKFEKWSIDGTVHEICCFSALMCFSFSLIILTNIFLEIELAKRGLEPSNVFWFWYSRNSVWGVSHHTIRQ